LWDIEMPRAYVLFNVGAGSEEQVLKDAKAVGGVQEAYVSYGVYDLVMQIKADSMEQLKELVTHRLRAIDNVRSTLTLILTEQ
jgi:DNA-binding Lrp family transcriptional regulator